MADIIKPKQKSNNKDVNFLLEKKDEIYKILAKNAQDELIFIIEQNGLSDLDLLSAIEASYIISNRRKLIPVLLNYISHPLPAIRESAISVLAKRTTKKIKDKFMDAYCEEQNEVIKDLLYSHITK